MKIVDEFKEFIARGNVMDMAVGIIVGGAFTAIVNSLVTNLITPGIHFLTAVTSTATGGAADEAGNVIAGLKWMVPGTDAAPEYVDLGTFIGAIINFLIIAFVVFLMVKSMNVFRRKKEAEAAPPAPPAPVSRSSTRSTAAAIRRRKRSISPAHCPAA